MGSVLPDGFDTAASAPWDPQAPLVFTHFMTTSADAIHRSLQRAAAQHGPNEAGYYEGLGGALHLFCFAENSENRRLLHFDRSIADTDTIHRTYLASSQPRISTNLEVPEGVTLRGLYRGVKDGDPGFSIADLEYKDSITDTDEGMLLSRIVVQ